MKQRRSWVVVGTVCLALSGCGGTQQQRSAADRSVLLRWFDQTSAAVAAQGPLPDPVAARTWALAWEAGDRATAGMTDGPVADGAMATAVHDVLVDLVPSRRGALDAALAQTKVPAGTSGPAAAAAAVLSQRRSDGLSLAEVERPAPVPAQLRPGVWRPTPPDFGPAREGGLPRARPFLLLRGSQLRPGPPPRPGSVAYRRDLQEVQALGQDSSATRTRAQTEVALFWSQSELEVQRRLLRQALIVEGVGTVTGTRLLSAYHRATVDAEIVGFDAKYAYQNWRPVTAIGLGSTGQAPGLPQPAWAPLIATPSFPEYPSTHTIYAATAATVLEHFLGAAPRRPLVITSPSLPGRHRSYTTWQQAVTENEDARVLAGIHFRTSDQVGSALGRAVATYDLQHL